jgi:hypothetical protein
LSVCIGRRQRAGGDGWLLLVLAAVAGTFVLGLGSQRGTRVPSAAFETELVWESPDTSATLASFLVPDR